MSIERGGRRILRTIEFSPGASWCKLCVAACMAKRNERLRTEGMKYINPDRAKPNDEDRYISNQEWICLAHTIRDFEFLLYCDLAQSLGLRAHEVLLLSERDFDLSKGTVMVTSLKRKDRERHMLYVRPDIVRKIKTSGIAFSFDYDGALRRWKKWVEIARLNTRWGLHVLRHLCATRLYEIGANEYEIERILRHKPQRMSARYVHIPKERLLEIFEKTWQMQPRIWENVGG